MFIIPVKFYAACVARGMTHEEICKLWALRRVLINSEYGMCPNNDPRKTNSSLSGECESSIND